MASLTQGCEFEQAPGDGEGQGSLECCSPQGCKESDTTERLNNNPQSSLLAYLGVRGKWEGERSLERC